MTEGAKKGQKEEMEMDNDVNVDREEDPNERSNGAGLIASERFRQVTVKGFTPKHDAEHDDHSLLIAAACYLTEAASPRHMEWPKVPAEWPWGREWWNPSADPIRNLVKAGALIAAEIDRLQRHESVLS